VSRLQTCLPESLAAAAKSTIAGWQSGGKVKRLWDRDASLWTGEDESKWLGWLDVVEEQLAQHDQLEPFAMDVHKRGFEHVLLLGMGGSSLCPEVLRITFGRVPHYPELHVLDSTDPAQVKAFEQALDIPKTLFIVSSKSGATLEPNIFEQYFFEPSKQRCKRPCNLWRSALHGSPPSRQTRGKGGTGPGRRGYVRRTACN
jgi:transaldolase/glucose-6-phosphate isomerase